MIFWRVVFTAVVVFAAEQRVVGELAPPGAANVQVVRTKSDASVTTNFTFTGSEKDLLAFYDSSLGWRKFHLPMFGSGDRAWTCIKTNPKMGQYVLHQFAAGWSSPTEKKLAILWIRVKDKRPEADCCEGCERLSSEKKEVSFQVQPMRGQSSE